MKYSLINPDVLEQAILDHQRYLNEYPHKRVLCDDVITPFSRAMKMEGYKEVLNSGGCAILSQCHFDDCKKMSSTLYSKDEHRYVACPHCQRISQNEQ